jgi:hypothetical protein
MVRTQRIAWIAYHGHEPGERVTLSCDERSCIHPDHIVLLSSGKARWAAKPIGELVEKSEETGCWTWLGYFNEKSKQAILSARIDGERLAVRALYKREMGPLGGKRLTRTCENERCVAPAHRIALTDAGGPVARPLAERFWSKVDKSSDPDGCWRWTGRTVKGYGTISTGNGKAYEAAHRVAWLLVHGEAPDPDLVLDHLCGNRLCVNVERHLEQVSFAENLARGHEAAAARLGPVEAPGEPVVLPAPYRDRFWGYVEKSPDPEGCWLWTAGLSHGDYGNFNYRFDGQWKSGAAHRIAFEELVGAAPKGLVLDHLCRVKRCVSPKHLEAVARQTNTARGWRALIEEREGLPRGGALSA